MFLDTETSQPRVECTILHVYVAPQALPFSGRSKDLLQIAKSFVAHRIAKLINSPKIFRRQFCVMCNKFRDSNDKPFKNNSKDKAALIFKA